MNGTLLAASRPAGQALPGVRVRLLAVGYLVLSSGCGTDAVGIEECRKIESARCEAAVHCGDRFQVEDLDSCRRFYRDQCLHGLVTRKPPPAGELDACVRVIKAAGSCAALHSPTARLGDCAEPVLSVEIDSGLTTVCEVVAYPERTRACAFLSPSPDAGTNLSENGGSGGAAGATQSGAPQSGAPGEQ